MSQRHIFSWDMVNPSLLLVLLQNPDSSLSLGFKPVFSVLSFQFNPAGHSATEPHSHVWWFAWLPPCLMEMELLIRALWQAKQSLVGSRRFGIPPISGPERVGNWVELVVIIFFHITWLQRHTDLSRTCTVTVQQFDLVYCLLCFLV